MAQILIGGDAAAGEVLAGRTFSAGTNYGAAGTMVDRAGDTAALSSSVSGTTLRLRASDGHRDGTNDFVTITDADFVAANIKDGVDIFGITGSLVPLDIKTQSSTFYNLLNSVVYTIPLPAGWTKITAIIVKLSSNPNELMMYARTNNTTGISGIDLMPSTYPQFSVTTTSFTLSNSSGAAIGITYELFGC